MSNDKDNEDKDKRNNDNNLKDDSFIEGFLEGVVTTIIHPFRWLRSIIGASK